MKLKLFSFAVALLLCLVPLGTAQSIIDPTLPNANASDDAVLHQGTNAGYVASGWDDFNRPDGTNMGPDWTEMAGDLGIKQNMGYGISQGYMLHNTVFDNYATSTCSVDFLPSFLPPNIIYVALICGAGNDFLFIKVQDNTFDGIYDRVFFYKNNNGGKWGTDPYYYDLAVPITGGRMTVHFDPTGDICYLDIDRDFDGIIDESFQCGGILSAGLNLGQGFGIGVYNNEPAFDNWSVNGGGPDFLTASPSTISAATGGKVDFSLMAGLANANRGYILLGSVNGTVPGIMLPGGMATLPLNPDYFMNFVVWNLNTPLFDQFWAMLDAAGDGSAKMDTTGLGAVSPGCIGTILYFAYALYNPWDFASNAVEIEVVP